MSLKNVNTHGFRLIEEPEKYSALSAYRFEQDLLVACQELKETLGKYKTLLDSYTELVENHRLVLAKLERTQDHV